MSTQRFVSIFLIAFSYFFATVDTALAHDEDAVCPPVPRQPATLNLIQLVSQNADVRTDLAESIAMGQIVNNNPNTNPVAGLDDYYDFIDALVTYNPQNINRGLTYNGIRVSMDGKNYCQWNILDMLSYSFFLVDRQITTDPRGQVQFKNQAFSDWMRQVAQAWGDHLATPASAAYIPDFTSDPNFGSWYCPSGPYLTFHDFFTRKLCATKFPANTRPIYGYDDDNTVVSIGDSTPAGWWPISDNGILATTYDGVAQSGRLIKGQLYNNVTEFVTGGPDETVLAEFGSIDPARFNGGTWTHQFLDVNNYHRLHIPVSGKLVYMKHIRSGVRMKSGWKAALGPGDVAHYDPQDTADWQFGQTRLMLGIQTEKNGIVLLSPMGMAQVAAIKLRDWVQLNAHGLKGREFANFQFGGSDFVVIFEKQAQFTLTAPQLAPVAPGAGVSYKPIKQGERYGCFGGNTQCSDRVLKPVNPPD